MNIITKLTLKEELAKLVARLSLSRDKSIFAQISEREGSLTATEAFAVDAIYLLNRPTIKQFSEFLCISQPNATYKINSLVAKGYVVKVPSTQDKREHYLEMTDKFHSYNSFSEHIVDKIADFSEKTLTKEDRAVIMRILKAFNESGSV